MTQTPLIVDGELIPRTDRIGCVFEIRIAIVEIGNMQLVIRIDCECGVQSDLPRIDGEHLPCRWCWWLEEGREI